MSGSLHERIAAVCGRSRPRSGSIRGPRTKSGALRWGAVALVCLAASGCANLVGQATSGLATDLTEAILDSNDPDVVRDGAPAYLIMLDALLRRGADNADLLRAAASLNGAYSTAFVTDETRRKAFADKALDLALRAACVDIAWMCQVRTLGFEDLERRGGGHGRA